MKSIILGLLVCVSSSVPCYSQDPCSIARLTDFIEAFKKVNLEEDSKLKFIKYASFDFESFSPVKGEVDGERYFEIGYSKKGVISEIIHHAEEKHPMNYKMLVRSLPEGRVLVVKRKIGDAYEFSRTVIVKFNTIEPYYAINFNPYFGTEHPASEYSTYPDFGEVDVKHISSIMYVHTDLYPIILLRLSEGRVVMSSLMNYSSDKRHFLESELASIFFPSNFYADLKVNEETCLPELFRKVDRTGDLNFYLYPNMHKFNDVPLWIYGGLHYYLGK